MNIQTLRYNISSTVRGYLGSDSLASAFLKCLKRPTIFALIILPVFAQAQVHEYLFNNNFNETNGGPALTEFLTCGASAGSYGMQTIVSGGVCLNFNAFCHNAKGGVHYTNPGQIITTSYTINLYVSFADLTGYVRLIDFSGNTSDFGLYALSGCLNLYGGAGGFGPCPTFNANTFYLITLVRNGSTNQIDVYVNGTLYGSVNDGSGLLSSSGPYNTGNGINFFTDNNCEARAGCLSYLSVSPTQATVSDVAQLWTNMNTINQATVYNYTPPSLSITPANATLTCATTSATLTASGGTAYSWSGGGTNATKTVVTPNTYTVTVTDAIGCTGTASATISQNIATPNATITPSSFILNCATPSVILTANGGGTYSWSGGSTAAAKTVSLPNTYTVTVTGANGCTATVSATVSQNIIAPSASVTPTSFTLTCSSPSTTLTAYGGTSYDWGAGNTAAINTVGSPNTYTVTVTGSNGCTASASSIVNQNITPPNAGISSPATILTCTTPSIVLVANGGGTYNWAGGPTASTYTINSVGNYTVTVTAANGCTASASTSITQNSTPPIVSINSPTAILTCATPSIVLTANGGGTYNWGGGITTATNNVSSANTYTVTVTGANGCTASTSTTITQNSIPPTAAISSPASILTCALPSIILTASGGTTYSWAGGPATALYTVNSPNTYTVTVSGANGCTATASILITVNNTPPLAVVNPTSFNITCTNPSTTLTASGGTSYNWGGGITIATNTVNAPNTYTVTVIDGNGCTATASSVITQSITVPPAAISPSFTTLDCNVLSSTLAASGGVSYNWGGGIITATNTVNSPNTYTVTVTDINGCTATASALITQDITQPSATVSPANTSLTCATPSVSLSASGGGTYNWGGGITTATYNVIAANTYTVTVTGANGCTATASSLVTQNTTTPTATITPSSAVLTCSTLSVLLTANGGVSYDWGGGTTTATNTVTIPNSYTVTVTGANGCTATSSSSVTQNITPPTASISTPNTTLTCILSSISLTASGGVSYNWGGGITIATNTVNSPNTYTVTVTDANGCTATASSIISQSITSPPAAISPSSATLNCNTLSSALIASGGVSYDWGGGITTVANTVNSPNTYTVTVTDVNGCTATASSLITQDITLPSAAVSPANTSVTCTTLSVTLTASGGGTYDWGGGINTTTNNVSSANTYIVTVTGTNGCTATASSVVTQNTTPPAATITPSSATLTCTILSVALTANGGASYDWGGGIITAATTVNSPNTYSVTVTGANGCTATASSIISQNIIPPVASISSPTTTLTCAVASIPLTASGGTSYNWGGGITTALNSVILPNTYTVSVTDTNGCTATASSVVSQNITPPNASVATGIMLTCAILNSTLTASSITANASYDWGGGNTSTSKTVTAPGNYIVTVTDPANGCTVSSSGTATQDIAAPNITLANTGILSCVTASVTINASSTTPNATYDWGGGNTTTSKVVATAGTYTITVTDPANSCTATASNTVQQNLNPPPVSIAPPAKLNCINASVTLTASSTVAGVTYDWGGGITTSTNTISSPASYPVTATDPANGCTASVAATVNQNLTVPTANIAQPGIINCHNPSITLSASSNAVIPAYNWGGGNTGSTYSVSVPGPYQVTITDNDNGCSASVSITVTDVPLMNLTETHTNVTCFSFSDGAIDLTVAGGQTPFSYLWSTAAVTEDISVLIAANYSVVVTDGINCTMSISVPITEPANILVTETHINVSCNGSNDASINVTVSGGNPPYAYRWNDADLNEDRTGLASGNYSLTVTYNNTCTTSISAPITEPAAMSLQPVVTNPTCATHGDDGSIVVTANGGTVPFSFLWNTGTTTSNYPNAGEGNYSLTVTDANGCSITDAYILNYLYDFVVDASPFVNIDLGSSTVLNYSLTGNTGNYISKWSPSYGLSCTDCVNAETSPVYSTLYNITITNDVGCISTDTVTVAVTPKYDAFIPNVFTPNGDNVNEVFQLFGKLNGLEYLQIQIFSRTGEKVYESYDHQFAWDGTYKGEKLAPQVFSWQLHLTWLNGHKDELRKGTLTLLK